MAANAFTLATELAILLAGRDPSWTRQADAGSDAAPSTPTAGVPLLDAPRALMVISLREEAHHRTARLTIPTLSIGDTFTVTIDSNPVTYDSTGDADLDEVVAGIADAVNGDGTVGALVTATAVRASDDTTAAGTRDSVKITGDAFADFSVDFADDGTSVVGVTADLADSDVRLWARMRAADGVVAPDVWVLQEQNTAPLTRGRVVIVDTGGFDRLFVELYGRTLDGSDGSGVVARDPDVWIGPAVSEVTS